MALGIVLLQGPRGVGFIVSDFIPGSLLAGTESEGHGHLEGLWGPWWGLFLMSEVPLHDEILSRCSQAPKVKDMATWKTYTPPGVHRKQPPSLGPPYGSRNSPTIGS